ncbi:MAG: redoxin domain-containing protein [Bacteroidota bacterium]
MTKFILRFSLFIIFLTSFTQVSSQEYKGFVFRIKVKNTPNKAAYLYKLYGDNTIVLDTNFFQPDNTVGFLLDSSFNTGMYRCLFGDNRFIDFIFNNESIDMVTCYEQPIDSMKVLISIENKILYEFLKLDRLYEQKTEYLIPLVRFYPVKDDFYHIAEKEFNNLQTSRENFILNTNKNYPDRFVSKFLSVHRTPIVDTKLDDNKKIEYMISHYFDNIDFNDTILFHSNALTTKIIGFLKFFRNENINQHDEELEFIKAVDFLMTKVKKTDLAYEFVLEYIVKGFERFKYEEVLEHIASTYQTKSECENEERKSMLQKALDFYKKTAIGQKAPDIILKNMEGIDTSLYEIKSNYKVIIFWQTTCPHCIEMLPEIKKLYDNQKNKKYEIFSVSIDTNTKAWIDFLILGGYDWVNVNESNGWNNKTMDDYNIFSTPTILIIDKSKIIISKPVTFQELKIELDKISN